MKKILLYAIMMSIISSTCVYATETSTVTETSSEVTYEIMEDTEINKEYNNKAGEKKTLPDTFTEWSSGTYGYERVMNLKSTGYYRDVKYAIYESDDAQWKSCILPELYGRGTWFCTVTRGKATGNTIENKVDGYYRDPIYNIPGCQWNERERIGS